MNMAPFMNENPYRDSVDAMRKATQTVCQQNMRVVADDVKNFYQPEEDGI